VEPAGQSSINDNLKGKESGASSLPILLSSLLAVSALLAAAYFIPWQKIKWGQITIGQTQTIIVSGYAETKEKTTVASFSAGVSQVSDNKDEAVSTVNKKVDDIIASLLKFGIDRADIKTENLNIYQQEEVYWEENRQKTRPGQWRVSNNISVILRDVDKASDLANLLAQSGATNTYGPNFTIDDTRKIADSLMKEALEDAKTKAQNLAQLAGKKLGGIISISEGANNNVSPLSSIGLGERGGGGVALEPGSSAISKTLTVVFEIKD